MKKKLMKFIDLTLPIKEGMLTFPSPNHPKVEISIMGKIKTAGRETRKIIMGTHTGTHIDAPLHFLKNGLTIDKLDLNILTGPAHMIDLNGIMGPIKVSHLRKLDDYPGIVRLIIRTGWSKKWNTEVYYTGYPYLSEKACRYIIRKKIKLLGFDTPSPDNPLDNFYSLKDSPNHKYFLKNKVILVEYLTNLDKIGNSDFFLIALPLRIAKADASPARVIAFRE